MNIIKLTNELLAAGLPVVSVRDGLPVADYSRDLTAPEELTAEQVIANHDPVDYAISPAAQIIQADGIDEAEFEIKAAPDSDVTLLVNSSPFVVHTDSSGRAVLDQVTATLAGTVILVTGQAGGLATCKAVVFAV